LGGVVFDEIGQRFAQFIAVGRTSPQHLCGTGIVQQCQQQMLYGDEFMPLLACFNEGHVQADFEFLGNHVGSFAPIDVVTVYGNGLELINGFAQTLQWVTRLIGCVHDLINFGGGDIFAKDTAHALSVQVDFQHDLGRGFSVFAEKLLQNHHHELHGGVVVIEHDHLVHLWGFGFLCSALQHH
jgi:hypothetical protein